MDLNQAQKEAVTHFEGPCMVLAGPGSGKTFTIANRIKYLIDKQHVSPESILVITFTKAASIEMSRRFFTLSGREKLPVTFGTFHGVFYGILRWAYGFTSENLLTEEKKLQLLKQIVSQLQIEYDDETEFYQNLCTNISMVKNQNQTLELFRAKEMNQEQFETIYQNYESTRKKMRKIDFDDMLILTLQLFQNQPDILKQWQKKFRYILVDEFQDINQVQYEVLKLLALPENNLFVVGDDDQSIYGFRGAKPELMLDFPKIYPGTRKVILNANYRSGKHIVHASQKVIRNNTKRFEKELKAVKKSKQLVHIQEVLDPMEEAQYVVKEIQKIYRQTETYNGIGVLYRTNTDARVISEVLVKYGIPFRMKEHMQNLYEHFIGQNMQAYFRMIDGGRQRKDFLEICNRPNRYIARESMNGTKISFEELKAFYCNKEWMQDRIDEWEVDLRVMEHMTPYACINYIRKHIGYNDFLREFAAYRHMNAEDYYQVLDEIQERAKEYKTRSEWFAHIEEYGEILAKQKAHEPEDGVNLLTMHGSKGLEYDTVFILEAVEGSMPYKKATLPEEIEEERRMFYVAMTRAKERLEVVYPKERYGKSVSSSRFVGELLKSEESD